MGAPPQFFGQAAEMKLKKYRHCMISLINNYNKRKNEYNGNIPYYPESQSWWL
jgi:hypothetical protein